MYTVAYDPARLTDWLEDHERKGLDEESTLDRFEGKVRRELMRWSQVDGVRFLRVAHADIKVMPSVGEEVWPGAEQAYMVMKTQILCMFIDNHYLVYESPEAHARALYQTKADNLRVSLVNDMMEAYCMPRAAAEMIVTLRGRQLVDVQEIFSRQSRLSA